MVLEITINGASVPQEAGVEIEAVGLEEWAPVDIAVAPVPRASDAQLRFGTEALGPPSMTPFDPMWRWRWQPGGIAGRVECELRVTTAGGEVLRRDFTLRLLPRAIDRQTHGELLRAIQREARMLALRLGGQALESATLVPLDTASRNVLEDALALIQRHSQLLLRCIETIAQRPYEGLRPRFIRRRLGEMGATGTLDLRDLTRGPLDLPGELASEGQALDALRAATGGPLPPEVTVGQSAASYDLPEHRFAAWLVGELARRARMVRGLAETVLEHWGRDTSTPRTDVEALKRLAIQADRTVREIERVLNVPLLIGLQPRAQLPRGQRLRRDRRYRPLLDIWRELRSTPLLILDVPLLYLPIGKLPVLYEGWTVLSVCRMLLELGELRVQRLLAPRSDGWAVSLVRDMPLLEVRICEWDVGLRYQPRYEPYTGLAEAFGSLDRYLRIPDLTLEITGSQQQWLIVLDAKYRLAADGHAPQDALDDIYAYKGSLGRDGQPCVRQAAVLYPGEGAGEDYGGIAALPHLPERMDSLRELLAKLFCAG